MPETQGPNKDIVLAWRPSGLLSPSHFDHKQIAGIPKYLGPALRFSKAWPGLLVHCVRCLAVAAKSAFWSDFCQGVPNQ